MSGGGSGSGTQNVNQTVTNRTELPQWYSDYLQQVMGRATTQAGDQTPPPIQQIAGLTPDQQHAYQLVRNYQGAANPFYQQGFSNLLNTRNLDWNGAVAPGMQPINFSGSAFTGGQDWRAAEAGLQGTAGTNTAASADPYLQTGANYLSQAGLGSAAQQANPYINQAVSQSGLGAASPYLQAAGTSFPQAANAYMSPYISGVTDRLAALAGRNLKENLLPAVNDQFIRAGQYGSTVNRDTVGRAIRDTQEALLGQQAQALEQGYGQAAQIYGQDAARQAQLAGIAGGLTGAQQQALLQAGSTTGGLSAADLSRLQGSGATLGQLGLGYAGANATDQARALQAYQALGNIGTNIGQLGLGSAQAQANYGLGQGQLGLGAAQAQGNLGLAAGQAMGQLGTGYQNAALQGATALESAGAAQQAQGQQNLNSLYNNQMQQWNLPWQNIANMSSVIQGLPVNMSSSGQSQTQQPGPSALSQIGGIGLGIAGLSQSGLFKAKGGAVRKPAYKKTHSYGSLPRRGLGFASAA